MKKCRVLSRMLFSLLTIVAVEVAAAPLASMAADHPASPEEFLCNLDQRADTHISGSTSIPTTDICGTCGQYQCANRQVGASCYGAYNPTAPWTSGGWGWCLPPTTSTCSDDRPLCQCLTEYP